MPVAVVVSLVVPAKTAAPCERLELGGVECVGIATGERAVVLGGSEETDFAAGRAIAMHSAVVAQLPAVPRPASVTAVGVAGVDPRALAAAMDSQTGVSGPGPPTATSETIDASGQVER